MSLTTPKSAWNFQQSLQAKAKACAASTRKPEQARERISLRDARPAAVGKADGAPAVGESLGSAVVGPRLAPPGDRSHAFSVRTMTPEVEQYLSKPSYYERWRIARTQ
jgi:hypothetical protein